jgi:hypothetical protein
MEYEDVTERARAAGWQLPDGWTVRASVEHDDTVTDPRNDEPNNPLIVRMWNLGAHEWGDASLWGVEAGTYPVEINAETGVVTTREINPLTEDYPLSELIPEALEMAQETLSLLMAADPVITYTPQS